MNEQLENKFDEKTIDLIINAAYGSASLLQKINAWLLIRKNEELRELYDEYNSTAQSVHSLDEEKLPKYILQNLEAETEMNLTAGESSFLADLTSILFEKPQIIFVTTAVVIALFISSIFFNSPKQINTSPYTTEEIQLANKQAKQAIAIVGKILNTTENTLTEEIIPDRVIKPINESFEYVNDLFKKGDI